MFKISALNETKNESKLGDEEKAMLDGNADCDGTFIFFQQSESIQLF